MLSMLGQQQRKCIGKPYMRTPLSTVICVADQWGHPNVAIPPWTYLVPELTLATTTVPSLNSRLSVEQQLVLTSHHPTVSLHPCTLPPLVPALHKVMHVLQDTLSTVSSQASLDVSLFHPTNHLPRNQFYTTRLLQCTCCLLAFVRLTRFTRARQLADRCP